MQITITDYPVPAVRIISDNSSRLVWMSDLQYESAALTDKCMQYVRASDLRPHVDNIARCLHRSPSDLQLVDFLTFHPVMIEVVL